MEDKLYFCYAVNIFEDRLFVLIYFLIKVVINSDKSWQCLSPVETQSA